MSADPVLFPPVNYHAPPMPPGGWALPPGVSLMGKLPGMIEDENMRAGEDGTLFGREHRLDAENDRALNITFEKRHPDKPYEQAKLLSE